MHSITCLVMIQLISLFMGHLALAWSEPGQDMAIAWPGHDQVTLETKPMELCHLMRITDGASDPALNSLDICS